MSNIIRVLVVDDSAFTRKVVREMLSRSPFIEVVGTARDGLEALELVESLKPDVVTCDLMMPNCDGVTFVRRQMKRRPLPILILTSTPENGDLAVDAMQAGALDIVRKPTALASSELLEIQAELIEKVKALGRISLKSRESEAPSTKKSATSVARFTKSPVDIVLIGLSTGGPQAIRRILSEIPADFPVPIAIVVHMPVGYTEFLAQKLNEICPLNVLEADDGLALIPGRVVVARAGKHLFFHRRSSGQVVAQLRTHPLDSPHRPSVNALFGSAAEVYCERVLAVVMTGMGNDGEQGAAWVKAKGGTVLTEAKESCVVYGMPRAVVEAGFSDAAISLSGMTNAILNRI